MTFSDVELIAKEAAREALKNFKKEQKEKFRKAVIYNTETLLNNFLELQYFFENCKDSCSESGPVSESGVSESVGECESDEVVVGSLRRSKRATLLLYVHAVKCFERLERVEPMKFKVIKYLYLDQDMQQLTWLDRNFEIEERLSISRRTLYNWRNEMINKLSIMLFGADGYILLTM